jgi:hypothetical protein
MKPTRRQFLVGAGGATLTIPFLGSLLSSSAADAQPLPTKNLITFQMTNGFFGHHWYPSDDAASGLRLVEPNVREMALSDIAGPISPLLDERFDPFRQKMVLMRHVDRLDQSNHQRGNQLMGWATPGDEEDTTPYIGLPSSIDQLVCEHVFDGLMSPLNVSINWRRSPSCSVSVDPSGNFVFAAGLRPHQAFEQLFADFRIDADLASRRRAYEKSIVDRVLPEYQRLRSHRRLSASDRHLLDEHIEHMHSLQLRLARGVGECTVPDEPVPDDFHSDPTNLTPAGDAAVDLAVAAIRCGLTRVVNLYLNPDTLYDTDLHGVDHHHGASHQSDDEGVAQVFAAQRWITDRLARLLNQLDAAPPASSGGSLLDESLILLSNEIGNQSGRDGNVEGQYDLNHIGLDVQTLLIGSADGALRTGLYLDYRTDFERARWTRYVGTAYNRVLITCMLAMGMRPEQWELDGPGYGDYRGAKYNKTPLDEVVGGDRSGMRELLPRLAPGS